MRTLTTIGTYTYEGIPGIQFVQASNVIWPLTPCCQASATGSDGGICCRVCYAEVQSAFGACWREGPEWDRERARLERATACTA